jgi:hypothetical protein
MTPFLVLTGKEIFPAGMDRSTNLWTGKPESGTGRPLTATRTEERWASVPVPRKPHRLTRWHIRWHEWPRIGMMKRPTWLGQAITLPRWVFREFCADHCQQMAAAIYFHLHFSLFPLPMTAVGIIGLETPGSGTRGTWCCRRW